MSSYGELIQALGVLKNVKEKRHGIKTLASFCAQRAFQVRIVQRGGWKQAILPLIISLDEECRKYASLAIANLSTHVGSHQQLLEEEVLRHLVPILHSEEVEEVIVYVLNALGNFAASRIMWPEMQKTSMIEQVVTALRLAQREDIKLNALFCLANLTSDPVSRAWMMERETHELVWTLLQHRNFEIMRYSLAILRGLCVESSAQDLFPRMGIVPLLVGIYGSQAPLPLKSLALSIFLHLSFNHANASILMERQAMSVIEQAARGDQNIEYIPTGMAIIANLCENVELHDRIVESPLYEAMKYHISNDNTSVQQHVLRALMQLSLSPKYHHVILATGVMANICPTALSERLTVEMRTNALQLMGAICATHPTTPTEGDVMDLMFLVCNKSEHTEIRRSAMMVIANASSDASNRDNLLRKPFIETLILCLSKATDVVLVDYLCLFFHNMSKLDSKAGSMMLQCGYQKHMFTYERLESLSLTSAIYLCDTCRQLSEDAVVRAGLMSETLISTLLDAWVTYVFNDKLAPHLALMLSAFAYHSDSHHDFLLQGGVRLVIELYSKTKIEHVRLCCLLSLLYLSESMHSQESIVQNRGLQVLLAACENETHIDLVTNSLKALIPFASSDNYRPQIGMEGGIDAFASFLFSDQLSLQQLGVYLLQNLLEFRANRRIFLGLAEERKCEEDYLEPLIRFLPRVHRGPPKKIAGVGKKKAARAAEDDDEKTLTPHDPFVVRSCIHALALLSLEHSIETYEKFINLQLPHLLFDLFYSEQIDKSSGEAILLFFANVLHSPKVLQGHILKIESKDKSRSTLPMLLSSREMGFAPHTGIRGLSAMLSVARVPEFRSRVLMQLDLIMVSLNANLSTEPRDEQFFSAAALHCALLCELVRSSPQYHEQLAKAGVVEAFLVFITVAGRGLRDEICVELLMSAVFGICALVASPASGEACMQNLLFPVTRVQLLMSLLRVSQEDINGTFHSGTVGVKTLQRTAEPTITAEELHVSGVSHEDFMDYCALPPANFLYRNVIRTLCLLLADRVMGRRVQEAIPHRNIVPTCMFALHACTDVFVQVFGYILVANFSREPVLRHGFIADASIMNEMLSSIRRFTDPQPDETETSAVAQLAKMARPAKGAWSASQTAVNRFMLAMVAMTELAENLKEKYRQEPPAGMESRDTLSLSNRKFLDKMTAVCMRDLDCEMLLNITKLTRVQEFTAMVRIVVAHNAFMAHINVDDIPKGGEVKCELIGAIASAVAVEDKKDLLLPELKPCFKGIRALQRKVNDLLAVVSAGIESNAAAPLLLGIVENLCGLTYLSPLAISDPQTLYRIFHQCPDWIQPGFTCLLCNLLATEARINPDPQFIDEDEDDRFQDAPTDVLFPLLATSTLEIRRNTLGALANAGTMPHLFAFVLGTGILRIYKPLPSRAFFVEHFALIIEMARMMTNVTVRPETHAKVNTQDTVAFLRDVLRHTTDLLHSGVDIAQPQDILYDYFDATFEEEDAPPLGLRIRWVDPPQISEVLPDTPAARLLPDLMDGDELIEVNGQDVTGMDREEIAPMMNDRPLEVRVRRKLDMTLKPREDSMDAYTDIAGGLQIEQIEKVVAYGDRAQYLECFNLALLTIHNLATSVANHEKLLAEPKILNILLKVVPSEILSPALRRLIFSMLTCLAQQTFISGRIFYVMQSYFLSCEKPDSSLQKYMMIVANLYYTSMDPEEVQPDQSILTFVSKISASEEQKEANAALCEILHGMSRAPPEKRKAFVSREIVGVTLKYLELPDQWIVQARAFEVAYFLTMAGCDHNLWKDLDVLGKMTKAAGTVVRLARGDALMIKRSDAIWEITLRACDHCLQYSDLLHCMNADPELHRFLMDLLVDGDRPNGLNKVAIDLMAGFLQSELAQGVWNRWKTMGVGEKLAKWFAHRRPRLEGHDEVAQGVGEPVPVGICTDNMMHMILFAVELDSSVISALVNEETLRCIAARIINHTSFYNKAHAAGGSADARTMTDADTAMRWITQLLTALAASQHGLEAMSHLNMEPYLLSLLELPSEDFRIAALIILCSLAGHKETCSKLLHSDIFKGVMKRVEADIQEADNALRPDEVEYVVCLLDRCCCFPDLARLVQQHEFRLICLLTVKSKTVNAKLLAVRALSRCSFVRPACTEALPVDSPECLHLLMASTSSLRNMTPEEEEQDAMAAIRRRTLIQGVTEMMDSNPHESKLAVHYSRAILCEAVSVSPFVCHTVYENIDYMSLMVEMSDAVDASFDRLEHGKGRLDIVAGELLNDIIGILHIVLCVVFRQDLEAAPDGAQPPPLAQALLRVLHAIGKLEDKAKEHEAAIADSGEGGHSNPQEATPKDLMETLTGDIRFIFYLSALLREICAKPLNSGFMQVVRSRVYYTVLKVLAREARERFKRQTIGPPPKDIFAVRKGNGLAASPLAPHMEDFQLGYVFESLLVCLRHSLTQAMYKPPAAADPTTEPWRWEAQETLQIHTEAMTWLPGVAKYFEKIPAVRVETVRYLCAVATFYKAPQAAPSPQDADAGDGALISPGSPSTAGERGAVERIALNKRCSFFKEEVLEMLTTELEQQTDPCTLSLASVAVANLAAYEFPNGAPKGSQLPMELFQRLIAALVRTLRMSPDQPGGVDSTSSRNCIRAFANMLALCSEPLTTLVMNGGVLEAVMDAFKSFFLDPFRISNTKHFVALLQDCVRFLRTWSSAGCLCEDAAKETGEEARSMRRELAKALKGFRDARPKEPGDEAVRPKDDDPWGASAVSTGLEATRLLNLTVKAIQRFTDQARPWQSALDNPDELLDEVFEDALEVSEWLLRRKEHLEKNPDFEQLKGRAFEDMLEQIKDHRFKRTGESDDVQLLNILYLLTKMGYRYTHMCFPDYLMEVAYKPREDHAQVQDVAAVCCAIISTQNSAGAKLSQPTCNVEAVVKDNAVFVHELMKVTDKRLQLWHYRLLIQWSLKPKVLEEVSRDAKALKFVVDGLLDPMLGRYSMVLVHNISVLRSGPVLKTEGHLDIVCEAYRRLVPNKEDDEPKERQRRMLRRLLLATVRNCLLNAADMSADLSHTDLSALVRLAADVEDMDFPLYLAILLHLCQDLPPERAEKALSVHAPLVERLLANTMEFSSTVTAAPRDTEEDLYGFIGTEAESALVEVVPESPTAGGFGDTQMSFTMRSTSTNMRGGASPPTPVRGLGKKTSLYQQQRRPAKGLLGGPTPVNQELKKEKSMTMKRNAYKEEFIYFACIEILAHMTFLASEEPLSDQATSPADGPAAAPDDGQSTLGGATSDASRDSAMKAAVDAAFAKYPMATWLATVKEQMKEHEARRLALSDLYVQVSAKFVWHCWINPAFRSNVETITNLQALASLVPFFLAWQNDETNWLISETCLRAGLHRYMTVCDYLVEHYSAYPELACAVLTHALVDETTNVNARQAIAYITVFGELLRNRYLSRSGLRRLVVGFETSLATDHPHGLCVHLAHKEHGLLAAVLEQLAAYSESGFVRRCMVVAIALTMGQHYKPLKELDTFVLRMLDLAPQLLDHEFELFFPVLHTVASLGGRRVQGPILSRNLHMQIAKALEAAVEDVKPTVTRSGMFTSGNLQAAQQEQASGQAQEQVDLDKGRDITMTSRQKMQWILTFFTTLAHGEEARGMTRFEEDDAATTGHMPDLHFDTFVSVELLPVLVKALRADAGVYEALTSCFLMSAVSASPCLPPYMPDVLRVAEKAFPMVLRPDSQQAEVESGNAASAGVAKRGLPLGATWRHIKLPVEKRMVLALRRCFLHLLSNAGHLPIERPALLASVAVMQFLVALQCEADVFEDPAATLHVKIFCLAYMSTKAENLAFLMDKYNILEVLKVTGKQIFDVTADRDPTTDAPDLRLVWIHTLISLQKHAGEKLLATAEYRELMLTALEFGESMMLENRQLAGKQRLNVKGLALTMECHQALALSAITARSRSDFKYIQPLCTYFLLEMVCSAPLLSLRLAACEHLVKVLNDSFSPATSGAVLVATPCKESFKRMICGPIDELASGCAGVMNAFAQHAGYAVHVHLLANLDAAVSMLGDPSIGAGRVVSLAELFVVLTQERTLEVIDAIYEVKDLRAFLGLSRSTQAQRRELVAKWLECYGSSLYEIDEVSEMFQASTLRGMLHLGTRSTLAPKDAQDLRRIIFGAIYNRVENWRSSMFGAKEFLSETLMSAMLPMCERQPDLIAAVVALFHQFITKKEDACLDRVWTGDHLAWLCQRMTHKSAAQQSAVSAKNKTSQEAPSSSKAPPKGWERHADLVITQGMVLRIIWALYDNYPAEVSAKCVTAECLVKNFREYFTYYCHFPWPLREDKEVEQGTDSVIIMAMEVVSRVVHDVNRNYQGRLIIHNILALCGIVLQPAPEAQSAMRAAMSEGAAATFGIDEAKGADNEEIDTSESLFLPEAKMLAGKVVAYLSRQPDAFKWYADNRFASVCIAMASQLNHWRKAVFEQHGSISVLATVTLLERQASLYIFILSRLTIDWYLQNLGLLHMAVLSPFMLQLWSDHGNVVLKHHALRLLSSYCQVQALFVTVLANTARAQKMSQAVHRTFGHFDQRETRHVMRLFVAALAHALSIPVLPEHVSGMVVKAVRQPDCEALYLLMSRGGIISANTAASTSLFLVRFLDPALRLCDQPGDAYGRTWGLWLVLTLLAHEEKPSTSSQQQAFQKPSKPVDPDVIILIPEVTHEQIVRRAKMAEERDKLTRSQTGEKPFAESEASSKSLIKDAGPPPCRLDWLRKTPQLCTCLARLAAKSVSSKEGGSVDGLLAGCAMTARGLIELPSDFMHGMVENLNGDAVMQCLAEPDKTVNLVGLMLMAIVSSFRMPLRAENTTSDFLRKFHNLQAQLIEGFYLSGEAPYDKAVRWLHEPPNGLPNEEDFRSLIAFMIGQCLCPPLASSPAVDEHRTTSQMPFGGAGGGAEEEEGGPPPVVECGEPPEVLLHKLATEALQEDARLRGAQAGNLGPLFSTFLCHLLFSLAVMVPVHPKAAAQSSGVRGAAFSQLMKVQGIIAQSIQPRALYEPADGKAREKVFLYVRTTSCIRMALQCIVGSWFSAKFGAKFAVGEEGGPDFIQYCSKHINQVYNNKTALTKAIGTPWERMMLTQGPTSTIAELLLVICSSDANLAEVSKLGGEAALHSLSRFGETAEVRQQATMFLTKLAVIATTRPKDSTAPLRVKPSSTS